MIKCDSDVKCGRHQWDIVGMHPHKEVVVRQCKLCRRCSFEVVELLGEYVHDDFIDKEEEKYG